MVPIKTEYGQLRESGLFHQSVNSERGRSAAAAVVSDRNFGLNEKLMQQQLLQRNGQFPSAAAQVLQATQNQRRLPNPQDTIVI